MDLLRVEPEVLDEVLVLRVVGEIDTSTAPLLRRHLTDACASPAAAVVAELSEVAFMGSAGLQLLGWSADWCAGRRVPFRVVATTRPILRVMQLSGMDQVLDIYPSLAEAMRGRTPSSTPNGRQENVADPD